MRLDRHTRRATLLTLMMITAAAVGTLAPAAQATNYGGHDVHGSIEVTYLGVGGRTGYLGLPTTDELVTPDGVGRYNHFQGGSIYWSPATDATEVHGAIHQRWAEMGWELGPLHYPVAFAEFGTPDGVGRVSRFQGGDIYWTPSTGAHEVLGAIFQLWSAQNYEMSPLGYPTSGEYAVPGGRRSDFQGGNITWTPTGGAVPHLTIPTPGPPSAPVPAGTVVVTGVGSRTVAYAKPAGPALVHMHTTRPTSGPFEVTARSSRYPESGQTLALMTSGYDAVAPLDFAFGPFLTPPTDFFQVRSDTTWEIDIIPLAATGTFGKRTTIGEARSTVWHYVGDAGTARITNNDPLGGLNVVAYDFKTGQRPTLVTQQGSFDTFVPIGADVYLQISTNAYQPEGRPFGNHEGPWAITVI